jgi:DNA (cytosine-5)-methyltransferase 1
MAESGWLTRSLEQPYPYTLDYQGKINNKDVKEAFLNIIDFIQTNPDKSEAILRLLLNQVRKIAEANRVKIVKLSNPEKINIKIIISCLEEHFDFNYKTHGASKLPVLAFYAIYKNLIKEIARYQSCALKDLGSHTASDRTSRSAGDIEILDENNNVIEAIEIKYGKAIDLQIVRIAKDKIIRFNPRRYCIFSSLDILDSETEIINQEISEIFKTHGCQVIVNGIIPTLKYYLRLIMSLESFVEDYSNLVQLDHELQSIHKIQWNKILSNL